MQLWSGIVTDKVQQSKDFYVRLFNAQVLYEGEGGWFVLLQIGNTELGFMLPDQPSQAAIFRQPFQGHGMWLTIEVENVQAYYEQMLAQQQPIIQALKDEPWGDRHFVISDPNGIGVDVVQRIQPDCVQP